MGTNMHIYQMQVLKECHSHEQLTLKMILLDVFRGTNIHLKWQTFPFRSVT